MDIINVGRLISTLRNPHCIFIDGLAIKLLDTIISDPAFVRQIHSRYVICHILWFRRYRLVREAVMMHQMFLFVFRFQRELY